MPIPLFEDLSWITDMVAATSKVSCISLCSYAKVDPPSLQTTMLDAVTVEDKFLDDFIASITNESALDGAEHADATSNSTAVFVSPAQALEIQDAINLPAAAPGASLSDGPSSTEASIVPILELFGTPASPSASSDITVSFEDLLHDPSSAVNPLTLAISS